MMANLPSGRYFAIVVKSIANHLSNFIDRHHYLNSLRYDSTCLNQDCQLLSIKRECRSYPARLRERCQMTASITCLLQTPIYTTVLSPTVPRATFALARLHSNAKSALCCNSNRSRPRTSCRSVPAWERPEDRRAFPPDRDATSKAQTQKGRGLPSP